jgi:bifunctional non-homologous end joining protein LigD
MQATQVKQPFHRDGWIYEEKIDGWRMLAYKDGRTVRLESRNGADHTRRFPDLAAAVAALPGRSLVLDGEVAIFDRQLRSRFDWLRDPDPDEVATPPPHGVRSAVSSGPRPDQAAWPALNGSAA